eukprot:Em0001g181a
MAAIVAPHSRHVRCSPLDTCSSSQEVRPSSSCLQGVCPSSGPSHQKVYPPSGIIPFKGFSLYMAPLGYLCDQAEHVYTLFGELYRRFFVQLHTISSCAEGILGLCCLFESLLQAKLPVVCQHFQRLGVEPFSLVCSTAHGAKGLLMDTKGILVYTKGLLVYTKGLLVYTKGLLVYTKGLLMDTKGLLVYTKGLLVDTKGLLVDTKGLLVDTKGLLMDTKGLLVYTKGLLVNTKGLLVYTKGLLCLQCPSSSSEHPISYKLLAMQT